MGISVASDLQTTSRSRRGGGTEKLAIFAAKLLVTGACFWYLSRGRNGPADRGGICHPAVAVGSHCPRWISGRGVGRLRRAAARRRARYLVRAEDSGAALPVAIFPVVCSASRGRPSCPSWAQ